MRTPSGGLHAYFTGTDQRNGHLPAHHLDFRSRGGYVLTPPSQVDGKPYQLVKTPGGRGALDWDAVVRHLHPQREPLPRDAQPGRQDLSGLARWVASQGEGNRNAGLFWAANRALDADPAADLSPLAAAARQAGLGEREITRTLESARRGGRTRTPAPDHQAEAGDDMTAPIVPPTGRDPASPGQREAARDYLTRLRQQGGTYRSIAAVAVLSPDTVYALASGSRRAQPGTAAAVLTVISPALPRARLDATGTRLRLRALHVMGHGSARIARAAGVHPVTIRKLVRGEARTVSAQLRDAIAGLYDAWWDKRAPGRTRFERAAATAARNRAMAGDWCAAAALDDDWLDIPGYQPEYGWKPATGTGTAPDIHPSALPQEKERHMPDDQRLTWGFILEVLDVLERHGYRRSDSEHTGQAIGLIRHVARIYEGTLDAPAGGYVVVPSSPATAPQAARPALARTPSSSRPTEVKTLLAALDDAAEYKRDRAETCADCTDQSCTTCQWRLQAADTYDQLAGQMIHAAEASTARQHAPGHAAPPSAGPHTAADKEAGQ